MNNEINKVKSILKNHFADIKQTNGIISLILSVCLIDTLAGFYNGYTNEHNKNKNYFNNFVNHYLPDYADDLYKIRCDIVHSFSNSLNYFFIDDTQFSEAFPSLKSILGSPVLKIDKLKDELFIAIDCYFSDLEINDDLLVKFNLRSNELGIITPSAIGVMKDLNGNIVSHITDLPDILHGPSGTKIATLAHVKINK